MNRETLIEQVKGEYAHLEAAHAQQHFVQTTSDITPQAYYENLLGMVIEQISTGTFDRFQSGRAIVDAVSKNKEKWLPGWEGRNRG